MSATLAALFLCLAPVAVDGDTLRCGGVGSVRLLAIDAPELAGHCRRGRRCVQGDGVASKAHLVRLLERGAVRCRPAGRDVYDRVLARCKAAGEDLSCAMVAAGFAVERYGRLNCRVPVRR